MAPLILAALVFGHVHGAHAHLASAVRSRARPAPALRVAARRANGPSRARGARAPAMSASEKADDSVIVDSLLDAVEEWVRERKVSEILPEQKVRSLLKAVRADVAFWERQHHQYERLWHSVESQLRQDKRPVREVLGEELSADLLVMLETFDTAPFVRGAMQSAAVERMLGSVLYEALFAFIKSVDILGQMVSGLPFLGPMRDQVIAQSKRQLDAVLGAGLYTKEAVKVAVRFFDDNPADLGRAQAALAESVLSKPFNEVIPPPADLALARDSLWLRLRTLRAPNEDELISGLYAEFGDETIDTLLPVSNPRVEQYSAPRIYIKSRDLLAANLHGFIASEHGRRCLRQLRALDADGGGELAGGKPKAAALAPADAKPDEQSSSADDWD
ncbi:hypothetical protein KFE25_007605 [Diacronema lutheri]|uniref:Uncharacterized protein n=1 Tax=Diacronema lutheri TaxID=2081491 RepID=A0A8J6CBS1_DIALT|nr:hypothetical protein KFE25_007605 [Diacronema lutheri]